MIDSSKRQWVLDYFQAQSFYFQKGGANQSKNLDPYPGIGLHRTHSVKVSAKEIVELFITLILNERMIEWMSWFVEVFNNVHQMA